MSKQIPHLGKLTCDVKALDRDTGRVVILKKGTAFLVHEHNNWAHGQTVTFSCGFDMFTARTEDFLYGE